MSENPQRKRHPSSCGSHRTDGECPVSSCLLGKQLATLSDSAFAIGAGPANHLGLDEGSCTDEHRPRSELLEGRCHFAGEADGLVLATLAGKPRPLPPSRSWPRHRSRPDAGLELCSVLGAVSNHCRDELEGGANGPLGVVLHCDRGSPDHHRGIADELLHNNRRSGQQWPGRARRSPSGPRGRPRDRVSPRRA